MTNRIPGRRRYGAADLLHIAGYRVPRLLPSGDATSAFQARESAVGYYEIFRQDISARR